MKITSILIILLFASVIFLPQVLPIAIASEQDENELGYSLEILDISYSESVVLGEDIDIIVTVQHYLWTVNDFEIYIYPKEKWKNALEGILITRTSRIFPAGLESRYVYWREVGREVGNSTFSFTYKYPTSASHNVELVVEAYIGSMLMDKQEISIEVISEKNWGLIVNGGFEADILGWKEELGNQSINVVSQGVLKDTIVLSESKCLKVLNIKRTAYSPNSSGVSQLINEKIFDEDTHLQFKVKLNIPTIIYPSVLTQISLKLGNDYRINYLLTQSIDSIYYREKLPYEVDILVTNATNEWQIINRNVSDDFIRSFDELSTFDNVTIIIEQATTRIMYLPAVIYVDDIALYETVSSDQQEQPKSIEPTPTIEEETEPIQNQTETTTPPSQALQLPSNDLLFLYAVAVVCIAIITSVILYRRAKQTKSTKYRQTRKKKS